MRSKLTEPKINSVRKHKENQSYDFLNYNDNNFNFVGLYKTAEETTKILEKSKSNESNANDNTKNKSVKREGSSCKKPKKHKQKLVQVSQINIDSSSLNSSGGANPQTNSKVTPSSSNTEQAGNVKSIMKNASTSDQSIDSARSNKSGGKSKKRNKSVSFMLEDNEELTIKRTKSDDSVVSTHKTVGDIAADVKDKKKQHKKSKKNQQSEKENTASNVNKSKTDVDAISSKATKTKVTKVIESQTFPVSTVGEAQISDKRKKFKKIKTQKADINTQQTEASQHLAASENTKNVSASESNDNISTENRSKKLKKMKYKKSVVVDTEEESGEPIAKSRKKDSNPDIVEDLENLNIGDNAHTLSNLLDEMTVVDKSKKKKLKQKINKKSRPKELNKEVNETLEGKEKVKWHKRKWNKDKKGILDDDALANTVVVENLPLNIMLNYKKLLTERFVKYGLIKSIGLAEVYPTEESKPVFTTTIHFYSDGAATQALELNNTEFESSRIRVKQPLPRTATTVVVRSYAELTDQNISSTFLGAGKIRSIKHLVKGKKSMATAFVEFDGPEAVKCALTKMAGSKIGGKKIHLAKFEPRLKKNKVKKQKNDDDSTADADSEDSND